MIDQDIYYTTDSHRKNYDGDVYQMIQENRQRTSYYEKVYIDFTPLVSNDIIFDILNPLINQIIFETATQHPGYISILCGLISRFFLILEDSSLFYKARIQTNSSMQEYLFIRLAQILEANHGRVSRHELERRLNYSGEYLNRIVKKQTGMSLMEYGQSFYLNEAKNLLIETDKSISQIINELGFANRSHFYRIFSQKYGVTPNEFRTINSKISH